MKGFVSVLVGLALAIAIIAVGNFGFDIPEGGGRGWLVAAAALVFFLFAFGPGRLWGRGGNLNSFTLFAALLTFPLSEKTQVLLFIAAVFVWVVGSTIASAPTQEWESCCHKPKWYKHPKFSLLPVLTIKRANEHNTKGFQFDWLFLRLWSLDAFSFELSFVADTHWGVGFNGILPYLRWVCCIPCPERVAMWAQAKLWRRPKREAAKAAWYHKKVAC